MQRDTRVDDPPEQEAPAAEAEADQEEAPKGKKARREKGVQEKSGPKKVAPREDLGGYVPRLKERYRSEIAPALQNELGLKNPMQVPKVTKVLVNVGLGEALTNPKAIESTERDIGAITGQRPVVTKARKSIAGFKIRAGMPIGVMVTLRGNQMYEFLDRLINIALPRIRDFRGAPNKGFDGRGNYSLGLREHVMFPEIDYNTIDRIRGLQVTIVTSARTDDAAKHLLILMGVAFAREADALAA